MVAATPTEVTTPADADRKPRGGFRADVQALRALAVLLVVLYHAGVPGLTGGFLGVDVFFVISGFLITGLLVREQERTGTISIIKFYGRRMRRIMPAAALVLIATVVASYQWLGYIRGAHIAEDAQWAAVFLANYHFAAVGTDYLSAQSDPSPLQHFWSLAVEEQFYVVWPALFLLLGWITKSARTKILPVALIVAASYVFSIVSTGQNATAAYFSPFARACELGAGALLALLVTQLAKLPQRIGVALSAAGMAGIVVAAFTMTDAMAFPGWVVAVPVLATCAVLAGGSVIHGTALDTAYRIRPIQLVGLWSYSLYLWHWPLLTIPWERLGHAPTPAARVLLVLAAVALSAATYYLVENPIRNMRFLRRHAVVSIALGLALIAAVVLVSVAAVISHPAIPTHVAF